MNADPQLWTAIRADLRRSLGRRVPAGEVDDLVQDVLVRLVASQGSLEPDRPLGPWVQTIARNAAIDRLRKREPIPPPEPIPASAEDTTIEAQDEAQRALLGAWLRIAVERLPEPYREAVHRVDVLGQSQAEVATSLGIPYPTLKSRVQRGRTKVREAFLACCEVQLDARGRPDEVAPREDCSCCDP